jgi:hypothetical protein
MLLSWNEIKKVFQTLCLKQGECLVVTSYSTVSISLNFQIIHYL